ncbi:peptidyl-tRNA hydrolase PTRHD1 [Sigmodon hispidus]
MAGSGAELQILVQYLVLRKDLSQAPFSWPTGALVAQACHTATAALHLHQDHPHMVAYLRELGRMHKVVLEAADEATLKELAETLKQKDIDNMLWLDQPDNIATCIALRPYPKEEVKPVFEEVLIVQVTVLAELDVSWDQEHMVSILKHCGLLSVLMGSSLPVRIIS